MSPLYKKDDTVRWRHMCSDCGKVEVLHIPIVGNHEKLKGTRDDLRDTSKMRAARGQGGKAATETTEPEKKETLTVAPVEKKRKGFLYAR